MIDNRWARVTTAGGILPGAGLSGTPIELLASGYSPQALGMMEVATTTGPTQIPEIDAFGLSLDIPREARFTTEDGEELFGTTFEDEHPQEWIDAIAQQGRALIVIAPHVSAHYPTIKDWLTEAWMAMVPTVLYAWSDGIGVTPPPTRDE